MSAFVQGFLSVDSSSCPPAASGPAHRRGLQEGPTAANASRSGTGVSAGAPELSKGSLADRVTAPSPRITWTLKCRP